LTEALGNREKDKIKIEKKVKKIGLAGFWEIRTYLARLREKSAAKIP